MPKPKPKPDPRPAKVLPTTTRTFRIPLAPLETWLADWHCWPPGHVPTPEQQQEFDEAIDVAYKRALRRRYADRMKAKKQGKPLPSLNDPIEPSPLDVPPITRPETRSVEAMELSRRMGVRDIWTPQIAKERQEAKELRQRRDEHLEPLRVALREQKRVYSARAAARKKGLPLPPLPPSIEPLKAELYRTMPGYPSYPRREKRTYRYFNPALDIQRG